MFDDVRRTAVIINKRASSTADVDLQAISDVFSNGADSVRLELINEPELISEALERACEASERIVLGGGDGTLSRSLPALLKSGLPVGILPLGTANDLARGLGLPDDAEAAARVIAAGHTRAIDLGVANGVPFFNAAGIGLGPALTHEMSAQEKRRWGVIAYFRAGWRALRRQGRFNVRVVCDDAEQQLRVVQVTVANGPYYGGGMKSDADATLYDGTLHVLCIRPDRLWDLLLLLPAALFGFAGRSADVVQLSGTRVRVETSKPLEVTTDGEFSTETPVDIEIRPQALQVYAVPES